MITPIIFAKYIFALGLILFGFLVSTKPNLKLNKKTMIPLVMFSFILFISIFFSTDKAESLERAFFSILFIFAFTILAISTPKTLNFAFFKVIEMVGFVYVALGLIYLFAFPQLSYEEGNFKAFTSNSNYYALFISVFFWPYLFIKFIQAPKGSLRKWTIFLFLIMAFFLVVESRSRTSMIVVILISTILFSKLILRWDLFNTLGRILRTIFFTSAVLLLVYSSDFFTNKYAYEVINFDGLFSTRTILIEYRLQGISERPLLGWGYSINSMEGRMEAPWIFNNYEKGTTILALIEEFGIFLGIFFFSILLWFGIIAFRVLLFSPLTSSIIIGSLIHSTFETWLFNFNSFYCWLFWISIIKTLSEYKDLLQAHNMKHTFKQTSKQVF